MIFLCIYCNNIDELFLMVGSGERMVVRDEWWFGG